MVAYLEIKYIIPFADLLVNGSLYSKIKNVKIAETSSELL